MTPFSADAARCLVLALIVRGVLPAQLYTGSISGLIRDPAGAAIPDAEVTSTDIDRGTRSSVKTGKSGLYLYELPFGRGRRFGGRQTNGIYRVDDGLPVQLFLCSGCSVSMPTYGNQYPNLLSPLKVAGTQNLNQYFAAPDTKVGDATFGKITAQANQSRQVQPGLKVYF